MIAPIRSNPVGWKSMATQKDSDDIMRLWFNAYNIGMCDTLGTLLRLGVITVNKYCELIELFKKEGCK